MTDQNNPSFDREKILSRLRKAQKMAEQSTNENEAMIAAALVQSILQEYGLQSSDIPEEKEYNYMTQDYIPVAYKRHFDSLLAYTVSSNNFVLGLWTKLPMENGDRVDALRFIGKKENVANVIFLFNNLRMRANVICNQRFIEYQNKGGMEHGKSWKNSWLIGFNSGLSDKLAAQKRQFEQNGGMALVVYSDKENLDFVNNGRTVGKLRKTVSNQKYHSDLHLGAWADGVKTGSEIDMQNGMNGEDRRKQLH